MIHGRHKAVGGAVVVPMRGFFLGRVLFFRRPRGLLCCSGQMGKKGWEGRRSLISRRKRSGGDALPPRSIAILRSSQIAPFLRLSRLPPFLSVLLEGVPPFGTRKGVEGRETLWFRQQLPPSLLLHTCRGKREKRPRSGRGGGRERGVKEGQLFPATTKSQKLFAFRDFAIEQKSCFLQVGTEQKRALLLLTLS